MKAAEVKFLHSAAGRKGGKPKGIKAGICLLGLLFASKGDSAGAQPPGPPPTQPCKGDAPPSLLPWDREPVPLVGGSGPGGGTGGCCTSLRASSHPKSVPVASLEDAQGLDVILGFSQAATMQCPSPGDSICPGEQMGPYRPCPNEARPPEGTCLSPSRHRAWGTVGLLSPRCVAWHVAGWLQTATGLLPHAGSHYWLFTPMCCPHISQSSSPGAALGPHQPPLPGLRDVPASRCPLQLSTEGGRNNQRRQNVKKQRLYSKI